MFVLAHYSGEATRQINLQEFKDETYQVKGGNLRKPAGVDLTPMTMSHL